MGMVQTDLKVKNPQNPDKVFQGKFLVDSGAIYSVVPEKILATLGIKPQNQEEFILADGRVIKRQIGNALYEYQGIERAAPVVFGEKDDDLLLGSFTLEALGLILDPFKRKLYKATLRL